jgi:hypothetical protein
MDPESAGRLWADQHWLLYGYFLRIVLELEKSPRDARRTKAKLPKAADSVFMPYSIGVNRYSVRVSGMVPLYDAARTFFQGQPPAGGNGS